MQQLTEEQRALLNDSIAPQPAVPEEMSTALTDARETDQYNQGMENAMANMFDRKAVNLEGTSDLKKVEIEQYLDQANQEAKPTSAQQTGYVVKGTNIPVTYRDGKYYYNNDGTEDEAKQVEKIGARKAKGAGAGKKETGGFKNTNNMRKDYMRHPTTKDTDKLASAYRKVANAATNASAAGDLSLIFGYMKMLDPGSTVREGEFANAQNTAGIPDRIRNMYNRAMEGTRLSDDQRTDFLGQSKNIWDAQRVTQDETDAQFRTFSEDYAIDFDKFKGNWDIKAPETKADKKAEDETASMPGEMDDQSVSDEEKSWETLSAKEKRALPDVERFRLFEKYKAIGAKNLQNSGMGAVK